MTPVAPATARSGGRARPAWLAGPSRLARIGRRGTRAWLAVAAMLVLATLLAARGPAADPIDGALGAALADGVRHGGDYYAVASDTARSLALPVSVRTTPLPTLFAILGRAPAPLALAAMMLLAVLVVLAWYARYGGVLVARRARVGAVLLMLVGMAVAIRPSLVAVPEGWAGLLVALSLARAAPGRAVEPAALGLAAATLTPAALPFAAIMALAAWRERAAREAAGWLLALLGGLGVLALHARALGIVAATATDPAAVDGAGPKGALAALGWATGLRALPTLLALPLVVVAILGWASRREPVASRTATAIVVQAALIAAVAAPDAALVVAPLLPLGMLAIPDALRDLLGPALDRRRITVTRVTR